MTSASPPDYSDFLGSEVPEWARKHRAENEEIYTQCSELSDSSVALLTRLQVMNTDVREIITSCLFARSIEFYQGAVSLLGLGLITPARVLVRCLLESTFTILAVTLSDDTLHQYIAQDEKTRLKLANILRSTKSANLEASRSAATDDFVAHLKERILEQKIIELGAEELARRADLHDLYVGIYTTTSPAVHSRPRDLQRYSVVGVDGALESLNFGPDDSETVPLLCAAALTLLRAHVAVERVFEQNIGERHAALLEYFERMGEWVKAPDKVSGRASSDS